MKSDDEKDTDSASQPDKELSACHRAPVKLVGGRGDFSDKDIGITMHYECTAENCGLPCDLYVEQVEPQGQQAESEELWNILENLVISLQGNYIYSDSLIRKAIKSIEPLIAQREQGARLEEVTRMSNDDVWPTTLSLSEYQKFRIKELKQLAAEREGNKE